jgi:hypothetical protein
MLLRAKILVSIENGKILVKSEGLANPKKGEKTIGSLLGMSLSKSESVDFKFPDSQHYNSDYLYPEARSIQQYFIWLLLKFSIL